MEIPVLVHAQMENIKQLIILAETAMIIA